MDNLEKNGLLDFLDWVLRLDIDRLDIVFLQSRYTCDTVNQVKANTRI